MQAQDRRAAIADYKKRENEPGIYALRCSASPGTVWVGSTPTLDTIQNRLWFSLRHGGHTHRGLQTAWIAHGADAFTFEVLERLEPEENAYLARAQLKDRATHWRRALKAEAI
ncbi:GIY-YIG nuclease family protein [Nitrospirillum sp. BR 11163]|uniref:GIY-YIG nuclease family protein n=1 Tax=Nitrospirillum sp. BR 11163 TaxID=3104323 RepID=UPI002AFE85BA|nr:GIY-YIG nuclease family protein [Nitrospirillum sp. BR 11163]MEA1677464.1 GIY-YIG nuclease family protein [Nitrospirillum sp. BR 11163]